MARSRCPADLTLTRSCSRSRKSPRAASTFSRWATGIYAVWYPQVQRRESRQFPAQLKALQEKDWLHVSLTVKQPEASGFGLHGSGMFILNPPWLLPPALRLAMPYLTQALAQDASAGFTLECELA